MNVTADWYRLRLLDGSNARFYTIMLVNQTSGESYPFYQIGTDGGYLAAPVLLQSLTFAPGERADILVDFSSFPVGTKLIFNNSAAAPFPMGDPATLDPATTGIIMQFTVTGESASEEPFTLPASLSPIVSPPNLADNGLSRTLTLKEIEGTNGPIEVLLNAQKWGADVSELPALGTTEDWYFVDLTPDTHPMHLHLVQFQLISRQDMNTTAYETDWLALNGNQPIPFPSNYTVKQLPVTNYLMGSPTGPDPNEMGWKDTIKTQPGQVTRIRVRFAPIDGQTYPFPASVGPGYVWHCHIIDHEDNEMMRPYMVTSSSLNVCKQNSTGALLSDWNFTLNTGITRTTDQTGCTVFGGLLPITYTVTEELKPGWSNITPLSQQITLPPEDQETLTFVNEEEEGVTTNGTIQVCKQNTTGALLSGWKFTTNDITRTTDESGCTIFDLAPDHYTVTETLKAGWTNVTPLSQDAIVEANTRASLLFINHEPAVIATPEFPSVLVPLISLSTMVLLVYALRRTDK